MLVLKALITKLKLLKEIPSALKILIGLEIEFFIAVIKVNFITIF
jgi:hypothetical protein